MLDAYLVLTASDGNTQIEGESSDWKFPKAIELRDFSFGDINWTWLYAVDEEGRLYFSEGDFQEYCEEHDPWRRHVMLAEAARLYPEVRNLAPVRAPGDSTCDICGGTGTRPESRRVCRCGGTGWLPAAVPERR